MVGAVFQCSYRFSRIAQLAGHLERRDRCHQRLCCVRSFGDGMDAAANPQPTSSTRTAPATALPGRRGWDAVGPLTSVRGRHRAAPLGGKRDEWGEGMSKETTVAVGETDAPIASRGACTSGRRRSPGLPQRQHAAPITMPLGGSSQGCGRPGKAEQFARGPGNGGGRTSSLAGERRPVARIAPWTGPQSATTTRKPDRRTPSTTRESARCSAGSPVRQRGRAASEAGPCGRTERARTARPLRLGGLRPRIGHARRLDWRATLVVGRFSRSRVADPLDRIQRRISLAGTMAGPVDCPQ